MEGPKDSKWADKKWGMKIECDADGLHQAVWGSQKCKGKAMAEIDYPWNECKAAPKADTDDVQRWIKFNSGEVKYGPSLMVAAATERHMGAYE